MTSCAFAPVASREHSGMTSCVSALALCVAGNLQVDRYNIDEERSVTITSGVSALTRVASGEQDHMSSGVSVLACVAGDVGGAYQNVEFGKASGLVRVASGEQGHVSSCLSTFTAVGGAYMHVAGGRSRISKVITPCILISMG